MIHYPECSTGLRWDENGVLVANHYYVHDSLMIIDWVRDLSAGRAQRCGEKLITMVESAGQTLWPEFTLYTGSFFNRRGPCDSLVIQQCLRFDDLVWNYRNRLMGKDLAQLAGSLQDRVEGFNVPTQRNDAAEFLATLELLSRRTLPRHDRIYARLPKCHLRFDYKILRSDEAERYVIAFGGINRKCCGRGFIEVIYR